jgi:cellulose synthase/poly-beta-1,6-N-acetylglucosamine synthase-like glycosyltransferase
MVALLLIPTALMLFYFGYLIRSAWHFRQLMATEQPKGSHFPSVTVVVPARSESKNIGQCVQAVLGQDYPSAKLELIVVDDHSEDGTVEVALAAAAGDPRFRLIHSSQQQGVAYKKAAVSQGIAAAKGEIILCTDADCHFGKDWVRSMMAHFGEKTGMLSGPVQLEGKGIFEEMQALEFMGLVAVGAAAIESGAPTMCNGANLAYRKAVFEQVGGFEGIDHIASGDDELLMHKIAYESEWEVGFAHSRDAVVRTAAQPDWKSFRQQRIRWVSKSRQYKQQRITWVLVLSYLAMAGLPILSILAFFWPIAGWCLLINLGLKMLGELAVLYQAARFFGKLQLLKWLVPEQLAHIAYVLWVGLAGNQKSYEWKGRQVK